MLNDSVQDLKGLFASNSAVCSQAMTLFQLIANKARFRILCLLTRGEFCVQEIAEIVDEGKLPNISQQLKMLRLAGLIGRRREKKQIIYHLADERVRHIILFLQQELLPPSSKASP